MIIRLSAPDDAPELERLARALFGAGDDVNFEDELVLVCDTGHGRLGGFISVSERPWTEGSDARPAAHIEGWYVDREWRRQGIGTKLVQAAEDWARRNGFSEICSDAELDNSISLEAHARLHFEPTLKLQYFRKILD